MSKGTDLHGTASGHSGIKEQSRKKLSNIDLKLEERELRWLEKVARAPHQEPWTWVTDCFIT